MSVNFTDHSLSINGISIVLPSIVKKYLEFNDCVVVITKDSPAINNIWAFDYQGKQLWQLELLEVVIQGDKEYVGFDKPFIDIEIESNQVLKIWDKYGGKYLVSVENGKFIQNPIESRIGRRPW